MVSTHLKNISQNWKSSPNRDENKKYLKPPPSANILPTTKFLPSRSLVDIGTRMWVGFAHIMWEPSWWTFLYVVPGADRNQDKLIIICCPFPFDPPADVSPKMMWKFRSSTRRLGGVYDHSPCFFFSTAKWKHTNHTNPGISLNGCFWFP